MLWRAGRGPARAAAPDVDFQPIAPPSARHGLSQTQNVQVLSLSDILQDKSIRPSLASFGKSLSGSFLLSAESLPLVSGPSTVQVLVEISYLLMSHTALT